jgi:ABC-2 type transport system ATP-binding protein
MRAVPASAIRTVDLQREFGGGLKAVQGIDLEVAPGEVYGFLGPNGAGKTTTVRMLVTLLRPTGGHAEIAGFDVAREPAEVRRRIGVALQEAALDLLMTGRELMELQATLHGIPRRAVAGRAGELIERVGLSQAAERRVGTYSGGMRRRLDLAMALIHAPDVLFLDEPTTGLDPTSRSTLWDEVRRLRDEGTTVFLTTQYLEEADQLADRVGIIDHGRLVAEGTPAALKAEVGRPRLDITLSGDAPDAAVAGAAIAPYGELCEAPAGVHVALRVESGAAAMAPVVRALDESGFAVEGIELVRPTLDDVFAEKTGHRLEGAEAATSADGAGAPAAPAVPS